MSHVIEVRAVEKSFAKKRTVPQLLKTLLRNPFERAERVHALRGVDLVVDRGEIHGLLGPNGAGKTTLLKILSCLILPDAGHVTIGGDPTTRETAVKRKIGLVHSDERSFYWRLSGRENLRFFAMLYDLPRRRVESRIDELLEVVQMVEPANQRFSDYSSGMKQRMAIARAMLHDPPILLMDEPTRSLDPASTLELRGFIKDHLQQDHRKTILLATHDLREAESLCDRLAILIKGRIRETGTVDTVRRWGVKERRFRLEVDRWPEGIAGPFRVDREMATEAGVTAEVLLDDGAGLSSVLETLIVRGVRIRSCDAVEPELEQAFARIVRHMDGDTAS